VSWLRPGSPSCSPPSTSPRQTSWPTGSRCSTRAGSSLKEPPAESKSRIPGGHVRLHFADPHLLHSAGELLEAAAPDEDQRVLQVPADGTVDSLRVLLDELHQARISVERLSIHTPDLDDVFFAVTGSHVTAQLNGDPAPQGVSLS
jgi:hypothetical protein